METQGHTKGYEAAAKRAKELCHAELLDWFLRLDAGTLRKSACELDQTKPTQRVPEAIACEGMRYWSGFTGDTYLVRAEHEGKPFYRVFATFKAGKAVSACVKGRLARELDRVLG